MNFKGGGENHHKLGSMCEIHVCDFAVRDKERPCFWFTLYKQYMNLFLPSSSSSSPKRTILFNPNLSHSVKNTTHTFAKISRLVCCMCVWGARAALRLPSCVRARACVARAVAVGIAVRAAVSGLMSAMFAAAPRAQRRRKADSVSL